MAINAIGGALYYRSQIELVNLKLRKMVVTNYGRL
jgi:hypothetical protein